MKLEPIWQPAIQQVLFRHLMQAMAYPGSIHKLHHDSQQTKPHRAILAMLLDAETSLCDLDEQLPKQDWLMLQAHPEDVSRADYILCDGARPTALSPRLGELSSPELSATLLLTVDNLQHGDNSVRLHGPGIKDPITIQPRGLHLQWWQQRARWSTDFPLGIDMILVDKDSLMCLPRTTQAEVLS